MYSNYTAFAQSLRAKSAFPYSQFPSSDQEFLQNPYCNPNANARTLQSNGYFSRQSALLYLTPSRTFLAAAATYLATTRRTQAKLPQCTASSSFTSCCVSVQEIRSCHCHSFPVGYRDGRNCHNGGGRKLLEREVRQVWRCNGDYECHCDKTELIERDRFRRREIYHEPRVSGNHRIDQYYDYWEFDDLRQNDDNFRVCDRRRRDTHVYEDHDRIRDSDRRRRDEYDYENDYRRRRDDRFRVLDRKEREEYDDYLRRRNGDIGVRVLDRKRRDNYDYDEDNVVRKGDKIRVSDRRRREVYDERDDDNLRVSDRRRRNEYNDYDEEDKVRASDRRRREEYGERDNKIRVSDRRRKDEYYDYDEDDKIRVSDRRKREEYDERDDKIRVSDRRGREEYDGRDDKIRVSDRRKKDIYYDYDEEDKIRVSDRRKNDMYFDYDEEDKIRVSDRKRREEYDERDEKMRVSDRRRKDEYYDYDKEDKIRVSDRRKREEYDERDDKIRVSDRTRKEEYHDYDEEDKIRVSDRRRRDAYNERDDDIRVSDRRKRDENYDYHDEDKMRILDRKRKELYKENNDKIRVSDRKRRDEYYDYDKRDKIRVSDKGGREEYNQRNDQIRVSDRRRNEEYYDYNEDDHSMRRQDKIRVSNQRDDQIRVSDRTRREEADDYEEIFNAQEMNDAIRVSEQRRNEEHDKYENDDTIKVSNLHRDEEASTSRIKYRDERENYNWRGSKEGSQSIKIIAEDDSSLVSRNNTNVVNQVKVSDNQLNTANTTQIDNQSKIHNASTSVQNQVQVRRDKRNISNQFAFNETELDLQNRISVDLQRKIVDSSGSVQNLTEIARDRKNSVNQINVNETELDIQNRNRIEMERKRFDTSTSVQNLTEIKRDKKNVLNQTNVNETELDIQNRNRTERERRKADTSTSIQDLTEITRDKKNVVNQININETELDIQNRNRIETERRRIDTDTSVQNLTEIKRNRRNIINQVNIQETEENVINNTNINLTRVRRNDTNTVTQGVETPILTSGSHQTSLESASRIEKSGSYHVGGFVDSVHQEFIDQSQVKNPSKSTASTSAGTGTGTETGTETRVSRKQNKSLWGFVADIVKLGFLKDESEKLKSGKRSSSSDSRGTDDWFSGPEEFDHDSKTKEEKEKETEKEEELPIMPLSEAGPSVPVNVQEIGPSLEEKIVLEEIRGEDSSSDVISGERIVREELPKVARYIVENKGLNRKKDIIEKPASSGFPGGINITGTISGTGGTASVLEAGASGEKIVMEELPKVAKYIGENEGLNRKRDVIERPAIGGSTGGINITGTISGISGTTGTGSLLKMASASEDKRTEEIKRGKQLKRITQVPKKSIDEWEDQYSRESESSSGGIRITDVSSSIDDVTTNVNLSGNNELKEDQQGLNLTRRKQFKRTSQVPKSSFDEWEKEEETHVRESETTGTSSTTIITELPKTGTLEAHIGTASGKHLRRSSQVPRGSFEEWEESYLKEKEQRRLDEFFMREALVEAERAAESWEVPVGAVLVRNGEIVARGCNLVEDMRDSTAHAEMICIREASNNLRSWRLSDTTLYVTLEPCAMCAGAILQARIDTIVWGAPNKLLGADGSWVRLFPGDTGSSSNASALEPPVQQTGPVHPFHPKIVIRRGVLETECSEIMQQFFQLRRRKKKNSKVPESSGSKTNPSCLPAVPAHPIKLFSKMQNLFTGMFCV